MRVTLICLHIHVCTYTCLCIYVFLYLYVCMYRCMFMLDGFNVYTWINPPPTVCISQVYVSVSSRCILHTSIRGYVYTHVRTSSNSLIYICTGCKVAIWHASSRVLTAIFKYIMWYKWFACDDITFISRTGITSISHTYEM